MLRLRTTTSRSSRFGACVAVVTMVGAVLFVVSGAASASTFTTVSPPITGASDFATNFPSNSLSTGPIGMIDDGTSFFVTDYANGLLYKFPITGGDAATVTSAADGLFGLTLSHGVYFGTTILGSTVDTFDPSTLATTATNISVPCGLGLGLAGDPLSTDLYVNTPCGLYRVQNPTSVSPTVTLFSTTVTDEFDGITISSDGQQFWVADIFGTDGPAPSVLEFNRSGTLVADVPDAAGPDGTAIALPNTNSGGINVSNNVFVNNNDGSVWRIDTNNSDAVSTVASGGSRGDMATVGPDGCLYATQTDRVEKLSPCFFQPSTPQLFLSSGSFVIGDQSATIGSTPIYWGAQWAKTNVLSGGTAPASFKGFADNTSSAPPSCGGTWTTAPGNSSKPPSSVPSEMAVIVSSSVTKSGPTISGDISEIVVVTTNPGYAPDPGHPGTGTVVSILCHT